MHSFTIDQIKLTHNALRPSSKALAIAHISDLHPRKWGHQHELLVETVNAHKMDFIFLTGDFLTNRPAGMVCTARLIEQMRCRYGLFACRGNWELSCGPPLRQLRPMMGQWGATLLVNESVTVSTHAGVVRVIGFDDLSRGWPDFEEALGPTAEPANLTVLLSHAPLAGLLLPEGHSVDLVLSGHTHGGQIRIPLLWRKILPRCHGGFSDGLYELGDLRLYVSRGFGSVGIVPLRFNCPAQVSLLRIFAPAERQPGGQG